MSKISVVAGTTPSRARQVAEEPMKPLEHLRKLPGVVAVALVDVVEQRQLAVRGAEQGVTYLPEVVASLLVLAPSSQMTAGVEGIQKGVEIRAVVADRGEIDRLAVEDALEQVLPHCGRRLGSDRVHVVPKAWRGQGDFRGRWHVPPENGLGEPDPHGPLATWADRPVDRGDRQVLTGGESLPAFGAVAVDEIDELCSGGFLPEGLGQSPLEDRCGDGSRSTPWTAATMSSSLPRDLCHTRRQRLSTRAHFE